MKDKERIKKFIELQDKDLKFEDIALELGIAKTTLRVFLNKKGYKMYNGKYKLKDESSEFKQIEFEQSENFNKNKFNNTKENKNTGNKRVKIKKEQDTKKKVDIKMNNKVDIKMNNNESNFRKNIKIEDTNLESLKSTTIKVDKNTWDDFERLCSNSEFSKQEIITQALKDFMKEYKNLL